MDRYSHTFTPTAGCLSCLDQRRAAVVVVALRISWLRVISLVPRMSMVVIMASIRPFSPRLPQRLHRPLARSRWRRQGRTTRVKVKTGARIRAVLMLPMTPRRLTPWVRACTMPTLLWHHLAQYYLTCIVYRYAARYCLVLCCCCVEYSYTYICA